MLSTIRFLDVATFTTISPLSFLFSCKLSFPIVSVKVFWGISLWHVILCHLTFICRHLEMAQWSHLPQLYGLCNVALNSHNRLLMGAWGTDRKAALIPCRNSLVGHHIILRLGHAHSEQNNTPYHQPLSTVCDILSLNDAFHCLICVRRDL
jgi:hypothetical protein